MPKRNFGLGSTQLHSCTLWYVLTLVAAILFDGLSLGIAGQNKLRQSSPIVGIELECELLFSDSSENILQPWLNPKSDYKVDLHLKHKDIAELLETFNQQADDGNTKKRQLDTLIRSLMRFDVQKAQRLSVEGREKVDIFLREWFFAVRSYSLSNFKDNFLHAEELRKKMQDFYTSNTEAAGMKILSTPFLLVAGILSYNYLDNPLATVLTTASGIGVAYALAGYFQYQLVVNELQEEFDKTGFPKSSIFNESAIVMDDKYFEKSISAFIRRSLSNRHMQSNTKSISDIEEAYGEDSYNTKDGDQIVDEIFLVHDSNFQNPKLLVVRTTDNQALDTFRFELYYLTFTQKKASNNTDLSDIRTPTKDQ